ncbi:DNA-binding MurR/RpiR family transcriptional regulator [Thermocatellispora tengchongensis]|uniref:DNA-binding MurR/RpiR family transcriptional regulator n=1 Tax=Thermocatellispora tengchongensis TaxID=1073253 RepID=A0A840P7N9_9ACTN|nr:MurR/RpiR family transcriptional regulator [Thermocatellispora tengchongensis]MBB5134616.1 DNA-binding MurR/RpiR family transcriptional regulator [Thermocatellispora tengchongensis]
MAAKAARRPARQPGPATTGARTAGPAGSSGPLTSGAVLAQIQAAAPSLVPSARRAMEVIIAEPEAVIGYAAADLAARANTAASTVVRACQQAGFKGFQDLKLALVRDLALRGTEQLVFSNELDSDSPPAKVLHTILGASSRALADATTTVDPVAFAGALDALHTRRRVLLVGNGQSSAPARDASYRLRMLGLSTTAPSDAIGQHLAARQLDDQGVCLTISHTGATRETLLAAETAKARGAYVIAVTSFRGSPLGDIADAPLVAGSPQQGFRLEATASRLAHLAITDALFVGLALRDPERSTAYLDAMADVTAEHSL